MLEKPELDDQKIIDCLKFEYGLTVKDIVFLPLGADLNTAVYKAVSHNGTAHFVKLRRGNFLQANLAVPKYLSDLGIRQIIPSLSTRKGQLWAGLPPFHVILYPYIEGQHGFERSLTDGQWVEFGAALKRFHAAEFPAAITHGIPREGFSPQWRKIVRKHLGQIEHEEFTDPVAEEMAAFLISKSGEILDLLERAKQLGRLLLDQPDKFILCHADIHAWNLLVVDNNTFYMVDWDTLIFAPKERDLMFIGCGLGGNRLTPQEEETLFYRGYGPTQIDPVAIAYYRYERIIEDLAVYCEQIFLSNDGGEDRKQSLVYLQSNFLPNGTIELAQRSDLTLHTPKI